MRMWEDIDSYQQFRLDIKHVDIYIIKTKTKFVDYYYSTLLLILIHIVDLSNQSEIFI